MRRSLLRVDAFRVGAGWVDALARPSQPVPDAVRCGVPYRIDVPDPPADALDRLVDLGALDVEADRGVLAALLPDAVDPQQVADALGVPQVKTSPAVGRDDGSVWVLAPRPIRAGRLSIVPASSAAPAVDTIRLADSSAFGTGLHPTTALCLELIDALIERDAPVASVLDVGTGSGILALAALHLGAARATGIDIDSDALAAAAENARLNDLADRFDLVHGSPEVLRGAWPLVFANVLPAPLIDMAPAIIRCIGHAGTLLLSGVPAGLARDVHRAYERLGMRLVRTDERAGWTATVLRTSW
jgi:ribosomal protein L11 methyltransferase